MEAVTALLAHPDDELMCAGTLARFASAGARVTLLVGFIEDWGPDGEQRGWVTRFEEFSASAAAIGAAPYVGSGADTPESTFCWNQPWVQNFERLLPPTDLLISHRVNDANTSHAALGQIARTLARKNRMDLWEIDQSIPGGLTDQAPNLLVDITDYIDQKNDAIYAYQSQLARYPGMDKAIAHRDALNGWHIGTQAAEGFTVVRSIL